MTVASNPNLQRHVGAALAASLTAYEWPGAVPSLTATWRRVPDYTIEDLGDLKVSVVPGPIAIRQQQIARGADSFDVSVGIVLARHVSSEAEIEQLEDLTMAMVDAVRSRTVALTGLDYAADYVDISVPVPFDREALTERNVFLSQIEVTYQVWVDKVAPIE